MTALQQLALKSNEPDAQFWRAAALNSEQFYFSECQLVARHLNAFNVKQQL